MTFFYIFRTFRIQYVTTPIAIMHAVYTNGRGTIEKKELLIFGVRLASWAI